jgi:NADH-quinone oxidoreductase subunit K
MVLNSIITNIFIIFFSIFGILFNYRNYLITLMGIELMLLCININFLTLSAYFNDYSGQIMSLLILTVAASESAIGIAVIICYYKLRGNISYNNKAILRY